MSMAAIGIGVGVAGLGTGIAGAVTAKGPKTYDPAEMTRDNVQALYSFGGPALTLNQMYNPAFAGIANTTAYNTLFGTPKSKQLRTVWDGNQYVQKMVKNPKTPGLLNMYKQVGNQMAQFNRNQTMQDLQFAPTAMQGYMNASPLLAGIQQQAQSGLAQGGALDASTRRELQQASLQDASLRGFGHSPLDAYNMYSSMGRASEERMRQRQQFALQSQQLMPDPLALSRQQSSAAMFGPAIGMQGAQWGRQASMPVLNPFAFNQMQPQAVDNTTSNTLGAISGGLLNLGGGMLGNMGGGQRPAQTGGYQQPTSYVGPRLT